MPDSETVRDAKSDLVLAHLHFAVLFDSIENSAVSTLEDAATGDLDIPVSAESAGIIEKAAGVSLTHEMDSTDIEAYGESDPVRTIISKRSLKFEAKFLETNKVVLEKFWGTVFDDENLDVSAKGGVTIKAPTLPKNVFYRTYLVATDDVNGEDLYAYYILPRVKLVNVANSESKDNDAVSYTMTFQAYRDAGLGFAALQGWCGPGWRSLVHKTGFVAAPASIEATPATLSTTAGDTDQLARCIGCLCHCSGLHCPGAQLAGLIGSPVSVASETGARQRLRDDRVAILRYFGHRLGCHVSGPGGELG